MSRNIINGPQDDSARDRRTAQTEVPKLNLRRLETIQHWLQYGAVITLAVFVGLIGFSWLQLRRINEEKSKAEASVARAKDELEKLEKKKDDLQAKVAVLQTVNNAYSEVTRSESDSGQADKIQRTFEDTISRTANPSQIPARIYLQIGREDQRKRAGDVARQLQTGGYIVPGLKQNKGEGVENVRLRAPRVSQIRFYQNDEVSQKDVSDIVGRLRGMGVQLKPVKLNPSANVRPRHYEIWFGDDF